MARVERHQLSVIAWAGLLFAFALVAFVPCSSACTYQKGPFIDELEAQSKTCRHLLCGRIFQTTHQAAGASASSCESWIALKAAATAALSAQGILILGETHDNATHHVLQHAALREFGRSAPRAAAVVFEQIRDDQQPGIEGFAAFTRNAARPATVADLRRFLDWDKSGWSKDIYDPLFSAVITQKLSIYPGDVPRPAIMKVAQEGEGALPEQERRRLGLHVALGAKLDAASIEEIEKAHCGAISKAAFEGMAYAQRYRDAHLADAALRAAAANGGAIMIAGTGHARTDRGVPWYIRGRAPETKVVSVVFVEVEENQTDPEGYVPRDPDGKPAADYLVFTARAERGDPCEKMRRK